HAEGRRGRGDETVLTERGTMAKELRELSEARSGGVVAQIWGFIRDTRKWWLTPIILMMLLLGLLFVIGGSGAAPFIYTIF
ncbi:MAG TPA: DUF5989 family protein, partial [Vicinamibacterales bacterium]